VYALRCLIHKDIQILRRSPLLVGLLIAYPVVIALMIGFALSSPPGKPKVAFYSEVPPGGGKISLGHQQINVSQYASRLYDSIQPIKVHSRDEAVAKVRNGEALAALDAAGNAYRFSTGARFSSWVRASRCWACATPARSCREPWRRCPLAPPCEPLCVR